MTTEEELEDMGLSSEQIACIVALMERRAQSEAVIYAGELIHRVFLRVDRDSVAGRALSRALGFTSDESLARAAKAFGVSKQYLHRIQAEIESKVDDMRPTNSGPNA